MGSGSSDSDVVQCPFWRGKTGVYKDGKFISSGFTVEFCDNLFGGVPACVVDEFYIESVQDVDEEFEWWARMSAKGWKFEESDLTTSRGSGRGKCEHFILSEVGKAMRAFEGRFYCVRVRW